MIGPIHPNHIHQLPDMEVTELYIYGASGHGKVVADIALVSGHHVYGFIDDNRYSIDKRVLGLPVFGGFEWISKRAQQTKLAVGLGIGDNRTRQHIAQHCRELDIPLITLVHPSAIVSSSALIGNGTVLMARVVVNADAEIGDGVILNTGVIVEHDCKIGDYAHLSPNSVMGGASNLGMMSWLGMGAAIIHCVSVGADCVVGAGAVVIKDLPDTVVAVGVPARICHRAISPEESTKDDNIN
jgi:sugar O-acyltransferase (sialic acid O-acetyltransferase NeuD family)